MRIDEVFMFVFKDPHDEMVVDTVILEKITGFGTIPILWCRNGEYRVVPKEIVKNTINILNMYAASNGKCTQPVSVISWSQGIPISNLAGRALIGE